MKWRSVIETLDRWATRIADHLTPERLRRWSPLFVLAGLVLLNVFIYWNTFGGEVAGDDNTFHFAEAARLRDCLGHHDFDFWNPSANSGFATGYYYQVLPQLVPAIGSWIFGGSILWWFQLGVFLPFVLAPAATYRGMRMMHATPWQAVGAAAAVALCAGQSKWGFASDGTFTVGLYTQGWAFVAFPLALGHGARWVDESRSLGPAAFWGLFVGLCHPVAGVALGIALFAGEVGRWIGRVVAAVWPFLGSEDLRPFRLILFLGAQIAILDLVFARDTFALSSTTEIVVVVVLALVDAGWLLFRADVQAWWESPYPAVEGPAVAPAFGRLLVLGVFLLIGSASAWLPVIIDYVGFGGFPHRVGGEDGWHLKDVKDALAGNVLDQGRPMVPIFTWLVPVIAIFVRSRWLPRLWAGAIAYFAILVIGPHMPHGRDDLFPAIRVLGGLQVMLALAIGAGFIVLVTEGRRRLRGWTHEISAREVLGAFGGIIIAGALFGVFFIHSRINNAYDYPDFHRDELDAVFPAIAAQTEGREQVRAGAEAHWSNLLPFVYANRNAMLQMGGAGLQSSPNYVYLWEQQDPTRSAMIYDAPLVLLKKQNEDQVAGGTVIMSTEHYELKSFPSSGLVVPVQVVGTLPPGREPARARGIVWVKSDQPLKNEVLAYDGFGGAGPVPQGLVLAYSRQPSGGADPDLTADVEATAPTTFEVKESWHPRWVAFLDGNPVAIRRVTPDYMAIDVPPGRHHLAWRFDRPLWAWLVWLLWPGVALLGWLVTRELDRRARGRGALPAARVVTATDVRAGDAATSTEPAASA